MEIADGIHSVGQRRGGESRCFLLDDGRGLTLIDTLWDADALPILDAIGRVGRRMSDLKHIVLTHGHRSHLSAARRRADPGGAASCAAVRQPLSHHRRVSDTAPPQSLWSAPPRRQDPWTAPTTTSASRRWAVAGAASARRSRSG